MLLLHRGDARPVGTEEEYQDLAEGEQLQLRLAGGALLCVGGHGAELDGQEADTGSEGAYHPRDGEGAAAGDAGACAGGGGDEDYAESGCRHACCAGEACLCAGEDSFGVSGR